MGNKEKMSNNNDKMTEIYDLSHEYETEIAPMIEELIQKCNKVGIPILVTGVTKGEVDEGHDNARYTSFTVFSGALVRMPSEMMAALSLSAPDSEENFEDAYRRALAFSLQGRNAQTDSERCDMRASVAYGIVRDCKERSIKSMESDVENLRRLSYLYASPMIMTTPIDITGGSNG